MTVTRALRRVARREVHSPRTAAMIFASVLALTLLAYLAIEIILSMVLLPPLVISPESTAEWLVELPDQRPAALVVLTGALVAVIGVLLCLSALTPGRLAKHRLESENRVIVADNAVIAAALARHLSDNAGVARDRVTVGVARRVIDVAVAPDAGAPLSDTQTREIIAEELVEYRLVGRVKIRIRDAVHSQGERS